MDYYECKNARHQRLEKFAVCKQCNLNHYLRKKVKARTSEHFKYDRYVLQAIDDLEEDLENSGV